MLQMEHLPKMQGRSRPLSNFLQKHHLKGRTFLLTKYSRHMKPTRSAWTCLQRSRECKATRAQADGAAAWGWCPLFDMKAEPCSCWYCLELLFNCSCIYAFRTEKRTLPSGTALRPGFWHHYRIGFKECLVRLGWGRNRNLLEGFGRRKDVEGKLPLPPPLKVHLATPQTVLISEAQAPSGHNCNTGY